MGPVSSEPGADSRAMTKSQPVALEVPVVATGARPGDQSEKRELFNEETETVLVLEHGAVIRLSAAVAVGQLVFLTNKQSGKEIVTQVLRKRSFKPTACYVELDFTEPAPDFWGVEFPKADAKPNFPEGGEATEIAEAEITEEEFGQPAPPPDEAEVVRLRREVEALKAQLKTVATTSEQQTAGHSTDIQQPSTGELENLKSLLESKKAAEEPEEEEKPEAAKPAVAKVEIMSPHEPAPLPPPSEAASQEEAKPSQNQAEQQTSPYPIRMQLPKAAAGTSNRASEFAADSAAITHAIEDHLLPKTSLDFERFPGVAVEPKTKLFSGKATRSLSGPIGAMVAAVLLLVAAGIAAYQLGWFSKLGAKSAKNNASKSAFPTPVAATPENMQPEPPNSLSTEAASASANEKPVSANHVSATQPGVRPEVKTGASMPETESPLSHGGVALAKPNAQPVPERASSKRAATPSKAAAETTSVASKGEDVFVPPKLVKAIKSLSPPEALWRYTSGNVVLDALVNETGRVESATVISGPKALHQRAITTVKEYLYQPATENGKPVPAHVEVKIQFWYEP